MDFNKNFNKRDYYRYFSLRRKFLVNNANISFNQRCKNLKIIPKYAKLRRNCLLKDVPMRNGKQEESSKQKEISDDRQQYDKLTV